MSAFQRLKTVAERYAGLMSAITDSLLFIAPDGTILETNDRVFSLTGYHRSELEGQNMAVLMEPEYGDHCRFFATIPDGLSMDIQPHMHVRVRQKSGDLVQVRISRCFYYSEEGRIFIAVISPL